MVTAQDRVKVLDFGLAKLREAQEIAVAASMPTRELTGEGKIVGTVAYMSPEQAEGRHVDERSDIFSLGVTTYRIAPRIEETTYSTTMALANGAVGTARKRSKNEPGRTPAVAHVASVWWVIEPSRATATKP